MSDVTMMEMLSDPEVMREAIWQIQTKLQALAMFNIEIIKRDYIEDLMRLGVEERLARSMVNIAAGKEGKRC